MFTKRGDVVGLNGGRSSVNTLDLDESQFSDAESECESSSSFHETDTNGGQFSDASETDDEEDIPLRDDRKKAGMQFHSSHAKQSGTEDLQVESSQAKANLSNPMIDDDYHEMQRHNQKMLSLMAEVTAKKNAITEATKLYGEKSERVEELKTKLAETIEMLDLLDDELGALLEMKQEAHETHKKHRDHQVKG